ncbi:L,D-transpeptidase [Clostridium sp. JS66]|uniref:L,D-transpeptidase n=1 Tax=Clostridium sp. JS66 TaxID=3064705 RepID=UPI00298D9ABB|nr:L,D-transpeptidase [Clostridium sp. JS66]WPC41934.1 L,D-transpeptidase [Clostridium sp. JS66]
MKKTIILSFILTCIFIFAPAFMVQFDDNSQGKVNTETLNKNNDKSNSDKKTINNSSDKNNLDKKTVTEDVAIFSSNTCFKKTYYIAANKVDVYTDNSGKGKVLFQLAKNDVVVAYKSENGYIYCEENKCGKRGWIKNNKDNLKGIVYKKTDYILDVDLIKQNINVIKNDNTIRTISCSTGIMGNQDTETPLGIFYVQNKGEYFYSNKYKEGARYYIKFFSNYLIHSIPVDEKGNIIEDERKKIGFPCSHGCIRISVKDAEWIYKNIPENSAVIIHY